MVVIKNRNPMKNKTKYKKPKSLKFNLNIAGNKRKKLILRF